MQPRFTRWWSLVTNAWHAVDGPTDAIDIELQTSPPDAALPAVSVSGKFTRMRVSDNGRGMDATTLERIFGHFYNQGAGRGTGSGWQSCTESSQPWRGVDVRSELARHDF